MQPILTRYRNNGFPTRSTTVSAGFYVPGQSISWTDKILSGSGFVAKPALDILSDSGIEVTVGMSCPVRHQPTKTLTNHM